MKKRRETEDQCKLMPKEDIAVKESLYYELDDAIFVVVRKNIYNNTGCVPSFLFTIPCTLYDDLLGVENCLP
jgi:hypothetical protein